MSGLVKHVLLVVAMHQEATPIVEQFGLSKIELAPFPWGFAMQAYEGWVPLMNSLDQEPYPEESSLSRVKETLESLRGG